MFNKLSPNFDMTGIVVLDKLSPETEYEYQVGWFFAEAELKTIQKFTDKQIEWPGIKGRFKTAASDPNASRSYIVGSCRYLLRMFGGAFFDDRGDKVFRSVLDQIQKQKRPVDALLMIGDQIYADDLSILSPDTRLDQFLDRYRTVLSQKHICDLMAQVPTYMILDDHEIEDNWPAKATPQDKVTLYPHAIHAYQIYQCSHSPLFNTTKDGRIEGSLSHFWYQFDDGCAEWFVMDARTERDLSGRKLISDFQMQALLEWLNDGSQRIKFVVSSVPVFPDMTKDSDDKWGAFPEQRRKVLDWILEKRIRKVVIVSGDVHCSFATRLTAASDTEFSVYSIVSSSFFWPYPHMDKGDFNFKSVLENTGTEKYTSELVSQVISDDNFARLDASLNEVRVSFFERKGEQLGETLVLPL